MLKLLESLPSLTTGAYLFSCTGGETPAVVSTEIKGDLDAKMLDALRELAQQRGDDPDGFRRALPTTCGTRFAQPCRDSAFLRRSLSVFWAMADRVFKEYMTNTAISMKSAMHWHCGTPSFTPSSTRPRRAQM